MAASRVFLSPGLFGFRTVGSYSYFTHVEAALVRRFQAAGREIAVHVVDVHPTSSIRRRAAALVGAIERHAKDGDQLHLLGHSTGGLDARLVASPTVNVSGVPLQARWHSRIRSVTSMNTPHYGTPLASFFATLSGQRLLYAVSALTVVALKLGAPPLALTSSLVAGFGRIDRAFGLELRVIEGLTERVVRVLDDASSRDVRQYLRLLRDDQGAIIQLSPESMDLFQAGVADSAHIRYQSVASYAPTPPISHWVRGLASPWGTLSGVIFATLYRLTALENPTYACAPPSDRAEPVLRAAFGETPPPLANDGVVPLRSQLWGELVWAGLGDHLDVVGHFAGGRGEPHIDWMTSGSGFTRSRFEGLMDAIVSGMLRVERDP